MITPTPEQQKQILELAPLVSDRQIAINLLLKYSEVVRFKMWMRKQGIEVPKRIKLKYKDTIVGKLED